MLSMPVGLLFAHWVADFLCQSDWMAINKSKQLTALTAHVAVYATGMLLLSAPFGLPVAVWAWFWGITFWTHFATDFVTSRITTALWFIDFQELKNSTWKSGFPAVGIDIDVWPYLSRVDASKRHWFFVVIGVDQLIHFVTLALTWRYLVG